MQYYLSGLGEDVIDRVLRQRYAGVYGDVRGDPKTRRECYRAGKLCGGAVGELAAWTVACGARQRRAALTGFGSAALAAVDETLREKRSLFLELASVGGAYGLKEGRAVVSEMVLDEAELTVAVILGDPALLRFFAACAS